MVSFAFARHRLILTVGNPVQLMNRALSTTETFNQCKQTQQNTPALAFLAVSVSARGYEIDLCLLDGE